MVRAGLRQRESDLRDGLARRERPGDRQHVALRAGVRRRPLHHRRAGGAGRQPNQQRAADVDRRARVVDDLEQVEHRQVVVLVFEDDARLGSNLDHALAAPAFSRPRPLPPSPSPPRRRSRQSARRARRPSAGTANSCEVSVSPSTMVVACTAVPAASPSNCARPCSSVLAVRVSAPTLSVTAWPAMLLPIRSRTTRTVTVRSGSSGAGSGVPAIADGSGMLTCALAPLARSSQ